MKNLSSKALIGGLAMLLSNSTHLYDLHSQWDWPYWYFHASVFQ